MAAHRLPHVDGIERLLHIVAGFKSDRLLRGSDRSEPRQHDHRDLGVKGAYLAQPVDARAPGHADVHDDRVRVMRAQQRYAFVNRIRAEHMVVVLEQETQAFARAELVVDDQNRRLSMSRWVGSRRIHDVISSRLSDGV